MSPGKKLCQGVKFWWEWGLMRGYNILHQGDLVETCEECVGSMHIAYKSQDRWFGDEISTQGSKFGTAPRCPKPVRTTEPIRLAHQCARLTGAKSCWRVQIWDFDELQSYTARLVANKKLLDAVIKMKDSKLQPGTMKPEYVVEKIIGGAGGKAGQGSRQGRWYSIWGGGAMVRRGSERVQQMRRSHKQVHRQCGGQRGSERGGGSAVATRSGEAPSKSGGTTSKSGGVTSDSGGVAGGNKQAAPKQQAGAAGADEPDLKYREKLGWIRVIMERFEDQRNPGAAAPGVQDRAVDFMRDIVPGMRPNARANTRVLRGFRPNMRREGKEVQQ
ncbi:hypothetical protein DFH08DRAFT_825768 [Mycena albidolilacea]|uniref:Uncharacterized protein n=1 Tax=Mycena albidolilacea TaxID=1033008 RepID=A0AAD6Z1I0_9AGAR|nr:hypothetical protein DFH08DRAFT_825768 [Mycena albidolilacea]